MASPVDKRNIMKKRLKKFSRFQSASWKPMNEERSWLPVAFLEELQADRARLKADNERLQADNVKLKADNERLRSWSHTCIW